MPTDPKPDRRVMMLDGGTGRELLRVGAPFRQPEWSALALIEAPEYVTEVHRAFAGAGADMITTNAYALVPFHIGEDRFASAGAQLARLAGRLAREVGDEFGITVAGSLPPALGSYRPDAFDRDEAHDVLSVLAAAQAPFVDVWLSETTSSIDEMELAADVVEELGGATPWWVSFTLADHLDTGMGAERAVLRSGESITDAVNAAIARDAAWVGFNCSPPEVMKPAVSEARQAHADIPIGVYANAFDLAGSTHEEGTGANAATHEMRADLDGGVYGDFAQRWIDAGATAIGGCCGIGSPQIGTLAERFSSASDA